MNRLLITICGRAGSKGFKNKNLKTFCGHPLVYYSLSAAELFIKKHPELHIDIALNTDSPELAELVAAKYPEVIFLPRGEEVPALDREKKWDFTAVAKVGDHLIGGDVLGTVQETPSILHKIMMPPKMSGTVKEIKSGSFTVEDVVAVIETDKGETKELTMIQKWPVRVGRPYKRKLSPDILLTTCLLYTSPSPRD